VLFGWINAQDRHLAKYAALYHALGATVVMRTVIPTLPAFAAPWYVARVAAGLLRRLADTYPGVPVVLAYFSNGGAFVHQQLLPLLAADAAAPARDRRYADVRIAGVVFDSCPAWLSPRSAARGLTEHIRSPFLRALAFYAVVAAFSLLTPYMWLARVPERYFETLERDALPCPALYVYSTDDTISLHQDITALARRRLARGHDVTAALIADEPSPHVAHLQANPLRYATTLATFLTHCGLAVPPGAAAAAASPDLASPRAALPTGDGEASPMLRRR